MSEFMVFGLICCGATLWFVGYFATCFGLADMTGIPWIGMPIYLFGTGIAFIVIGYFRRDKNRS